MGRHPRVRVYAAAVTSLLVSALAQPVKGQQLHTVIEPRARLFPAVGPGVAAVKRDAFGDYYILAQPANAVLVYDSGGRLKRQIPAAGLQTAKISYAVDLDFSSDGLLLVADRGANAVEFFSRDGVLVTRVPVAAPTSVVALPGGQFAVTSLTSKELIKILDQKGNVVRSFGDPADLESLDQNQTEKSLFDWGKIVGSSDGAIYFAFKSLPEPVLRKYDLYGYLGYETSLPKNLFDAREVARTDRVEFKLNVTHLSLSDQTDSWFSIGSSGDVKFGGGMGTGLSHALGAGGGLGRGAGQMNMWGPGLGNAPGGAAGGSFGGTFAGEITDQGAQFQFGAGSLSALRHGARGLYGGASGLNQSAPQGGTLQFLGSGNGDTDPYAEVLAFTASDSALQGNANLESDSGTYVSPNAALPAAFAYSSLFNSVGFQPLGGRGASFGRFASAAAQPGHMNFGAEAGGPATGAHFGDGHFGPRGRFGAGEADVTATLRVNLGDISGKPLDKPAITATAVDPSTGELWAGVGDTLVHFGRDGTPAEIYALTLKGGVPLKPSALLIEPDRLLVAADPWGIFEFPRSK